MHHAVMLGGDRSNSNAVAAIPSHSRAWCMVEVSPVLCT